MGHMRRLTVVQLPADPLRVHYIPHHAIWQRKNGGQKLRVVLNASCPTTYSRSLNGILRPGPKMQSDLTVILTRWRRWSIAHCVDIQMMFRQIRINLKDAHLQRIVWSPSADEHETHYVLCTVTYRESCALYLVLRTLKQLRVDGRGSFPEAVKARAVRLRLPLRHQQRRKRFPPTRSTRTTAPSWWL